MLVSLCYVLLRWLLEFVVLRVRSKELKELEIVVLRHELAIFVGRCDVRRSPRSTACFSAPQPAPAPRAVAILHRHPGDAAAMASAVGRQAVDVRASGRPSADATCDSRPGAAARAREPEVGLSTDCRRAEGAWRHGVSEHRGRVAPGRWSRTGGQARRDDVARVHPGAPPEPVGRRFLHRRDNSAGATLRPLLHRVGKPPCAHGWVHAKPERALGRPASAAVVVDLAEARRTHKVSDSRSRSEIHRAF